MVLNVGQDGENNPYTETPGNDAKIDPKGATLDLLFGVRRAIGVGVRFHKAKSAILIRPTKTLMTAWRSMPRTTPNKNMPSWVIDGRWEIGDGRWGKVDSLEQESSFTANRHGEDHPDQEAADDVLGCLTQDDNDEG